MLEINNLIVSVEGTKILNGLNLKINKGEIHAIMGPNGSGKSTLSNVIAGKPGYNIENGEIIYIERWAGESYAKRSMVLAKPSIKLSISETVL